MKTITLQDRYTTERGTVFLSGMQALTLLPMIQRRRDRAAGLNTAGYISGYRGSPLGGYDSALWAAKQHLAAEDILFRPAVNEELAATAVHGTQQIGFLGRPTRDGVFAMWYGKGPGVDRAGDALKHGALSGTAANGGVLVLAGDDHAAKSSTTAHQSDQALEAAFIPTLYPANLEEYLAFGTAGFALSRFSGTWIGMKCVTETADSTTTVSVDPAYRGFALPEVECPAAGLNILEVEPYVAQEQRLVRYRLPAAMAWARLNRFDRTVIAPEKRRLGIISAGKSWRDVMQALAKLRLEDESARALGIGVYKIGLTWPVEPEGLTAFACGYQEVLVVEEKRPFLERQVRDILYGQPADRRPDVSGKRSPDGTSLLPSDGELTPTQVANVIARRLQATGAAVPAPLKQSRIPESLPAEPLTSLVRTAYFCSGCPHNRSTNLPEGSRALSGIGCHTVASRMPERRTLRPVQMGGEGANWVGAAPFLEADHIFQNLGDGTYFHSGLLAIRQAVAARVNITYKILFNGAVAMTGGQPIDGDISVPQLAAQVRAEGVETLVVVSDDPSRYPVGSLPEKVSVRHRHDLDAVQRELRACSGVSVLIYDQACAAERRRRRKRGKEAEATTRAFINELVCEGCGDCGAQSNCVSLVPSETEFGRKRRIDQSSCNTDLTCLEGFCPSFVTVEGGRLRRGTVAVPAPAHDLPAPPLLEKADGCAILITGVGGSGVVTLGAILGMAAHLEGKAASIIDQTGSAQKNGAVLSHVRIANESGTIRAARIGRGEADVLIACDLITTGLPEAVGALRRGETRAIVNMSVQPPGSFTRNPDLDLRGELIAGKLKRLCDVAMSRFTDAAEVARRDFSDSVAANMIMLGMAAQAGALPVGIAALEQAVRLNGTAVDSNLAALAWGRQIALEQVKSRVEPKEPSLDELVERRVRFLAHYQDAAYAARYQALVTMARDAAGPFGARGEGFGWAVARGAFKLMAYKDEYEVARLYSGDFFREALARQFESAPKLRYHLAPPLLARTDPATGRPRKRSFGPWMGSVFRLLAKARGLRGTPFDPFGYAAERRMERALVSDYFTMVERLCRGLSAANIDAAIEAAAFAEQVRGFGPVKAANLPKALARRDEALLRFNSTDSKKIAA